MVLLSSSYSTTDSIVAMYNNDLQNHLPSSILPYTSTFAAGRPRPSKNRDKLRILYFTIVGDVVAADMLYLCSGHAHAHQRNVHQVRLFLHSFYVCVCAACIQYIHTKVRTAARIRTSVYDVFAPPPATHPLAETVYDICRSRDDAGRRRVESARARAGSTINHHCGRSDQRKPQLYRSTYTYCVYL